MKKMFRSLIRHCLKPELDKLRECEERLSVIEKQKQSSKQGSEETYIHIETLNVEKVDYHLEFGELTIDELSGRLNIGATYYIPPEEKDKKCQRKPEAPSTPAVTIRSKRQ
ncbi:hypothetical protein [Bacillus subtilis]|uniref:hypothetical protein n=1 Tax=Bacillus TaxID=1386 RepID=UPI0002D3DA14|nr:hypothetical protein [Bacillus subtilis]MEC1057423.1 hypothetical protein [Bacillus subtilis]CAF1725677.1 hypothetical protein NRS6094_01021 [Bacillus subtilis]